jgi:hypothetical protein
MSDESEALTVGVDLIDSDGEAIRSLAGIEVPQEDVVRLTVTPVGGGGAVFIDLSARAAREVGGQLSKGGMRAWNLDGSGAVR